MLLTAALAGLAGCGGRQASAPAPSGAAGGSGCEVRNDTRLSIATGNTGGVYYVLGGRFGELVTQATGGKLKATAGWSHQAPPLFTGLETSLACSLTRRSS